MRGERTCVVCGAKYLYCPSCGKGDPKETWRYLYDSQECKDVFDIVSRYVNKGIEQKEAARRLNALNIKSAVKFNDDIQSKIDEIRSYKEKSSKAESKIVNED